MKPDKSKKFPPPVEPLLSWIFPPVFLPFLFIPWSLFVLVSFFSTFPIRMDSLLTILDGFSQSQFMHPYMLKALEALLLAAWLVWLAYLIGNWLLSHLASGDAYRDIERLVFGAGLGLGALSFFTFAMGALRLWYPAVFWGSFGALSGLFILTGRYALPLGHKPPRPEASGEAPWRSVWIAVLGIFLLLFVLGDLTPEIFYDALYYHIAVPNLYQISHRMYAIPTLLFSNFVLTVQMLYGAALTLGNAITAKLLHGCMGILLAFAFIGFGERYLSPGAGLLSGVIFLSLPQVGANVISTGSDVAGSFLQFAAGYALVRAMTQPAKQSWILAGLMTGLAASCKYPAFPVIPFAGLLLVWRRRFDEHQEWKVVSRDLLLLLVPALLVLSPYLIRNSVFHGNPLYPFGGTVWGYPKIDSRHWQIFVSDANTRVLSQEFRSVGSFTRFILHPWFIPMQRETGGNMFGVLYLLFLPLLFLARSTSPAFITLRRYVLLLWILWMVSTTTPRYGFPALALLAPLLAEIMITACRSKTLRVFVMTVALSAALSNLYNFLIIIFNTGGWQVLGGLTTEEAYLSDVHPTYPIPPYEGIYWMNQNLPASSKILFVGEPRSYYIHFPSIVSAVPDPQPLVEYSRQARNGAEMAELMRRQNITHLFVNYAEAVRTESYGLFPWDPASWEVFKEFWSQEVRFVWKKESLERYNPKALYVYELLSEKEAAEPHAAPLNIFDRWAPKPRPDRVDHVIGDN